jgi:hypothetical protein
MAPPADPAATRHATVAVLAIAAAAFALAPLPRCDHETQRAVAVSAVVSLAGFFATRALIPLVAARTLRAGLFGLDINKKGQWRMEWEGWWRGRGR